MLRVGPLGCRLSDGQAESNHFRQAKSIWYVGGGGVDTERDNRVKTWEFGVLNVDMDPAWKNNI
jgi:hypothetical protein